MSGASPGAAGRALSPGTLPESTIDTPGRVRLRRLELHGFKTFASRAVLEFAPGITAIVGPNGSGKSNTADAVRWVLGEQSLKLLRGRKSEDVIFTGGAGRAPLGMAEVRLTLENAGDALPLEFGEIELARRAYRTGESEYYLNRGRVRLRDVVDVLSRAGVGQNGHSVIGQGMVDLALSLRPEERRTLFEDAGGQRRFQAKKAEAEAKLGEVRANATRVVDVIAELEPRLASLRRQAKRAEDEVRLRADLRRHMLALLAHQRWEIEEALATRQPQADHLAAACRQALEQASVAAGATERAQSALGEASRTLATIEAERANARESLERARREAAVERERERGAEWAVSEARARSQRLAERVQAAESAVPLAQQAQAEAEAALQAARTLATAAEQALARHQPVETQHGGAQPAQDALAEATRRLTQVTTRLRESERQLSAVRRQQMEAADGLARTVDSVRSGALRLAELGERAGQRQARRQELEAASAAAAQLRASAEADSRRLANELAHLERQIGALETKLSVLQDVDGAVSLPAAEDERKAISTGRAGAITDQGAGSEARAPRLAERLDVPPEMEAAVAAAAGPALEWIVVDTVQEAAEHALRWAREGGERTTFIAREAAGHDASLSLPGLPAHEGGLGYLADLLPAHEAAALHRVVLGDTYVVQNLSHALALQGSLNGGPRPQIVTLAGETVHARGAITVGAPPSEAAALQRQRQIREGEIELACLREAHAPLAARLAAAQEALRDQAAAERDADARLRDLLQQQSREEGERRGLAQQQARLERDAGWWEEYQSRTVAQLTQLEAQVKTLGEQQGAAQAAYQRASERAQAAAAAAQREQAALDELRDGVAAARTAAAVAEQQVAQAAQRLSAARTAATAAREEQRAAQGRLEETERQRAACATRAANGSSAAQTIEARLTTLDQQMREARSRVDCLQAEIEQHRQAAAQARELAAQAEREAAKLQADRATLTERLRALHEQAAREVGELPPAQRADASTVELSHQVESLQQRLQGLGPVNQVALQEHAETRERVTFLKAQLADLNQSAAALETAKAELEAGLVADFGKTFQAVAEHFRTYFRRLFGGGDASLGLTDPKDLAEAGVEITAQLPGKRRQELALLSGGERALVAAALLFALLKARPSPFCVMDEVDAALDEANVGRFCDVLEELSQQTQFVVVTHNRATMERADALYGVTLGEEGVSHIVSLNLREALTTLSADGGANRPARSPVRVN